jgi:hypothetical protein
MSPTSPKIEVLIGNREDVNVQGGFVEMLFRLHQLRVMKLWVHYLRRGQM